jgi:hypothetical protein
MAMVCNTHIRLLVQYLGFLLNAVVVTLVPAQYGKHHGWRIKQYSYRALHFLSCDHDPDAHRHMQMWESQRTAPFFNCVETGLDVLHSQLAFHLPHVHTQTHEKMQLTP